jgi:transposase
MFWAGFGSNLRTQLVPLDGDPESARGGVSSIFWLYSDWLPALLRPGDIFLQDNAPVHRAHIIRKLFSNLGVNVMDWSPYSPYLNPIENFWAFMKAKIYELYSIHTLNMHQILRRFLRN